MKNKKLGKSKDKDYKYTKEQEELIEEIEKTTNEWKLCREYFENVEDPKLVDYAIYKEQAIKCRYIYLLLQARKMGIKVDNYQSYMRKVSGD